MIDANSWRHSDSISRQERALVMHRPITHLQLYIAPQLSKSYTLDPIVWCPIRTQVARVSPVRSTRGFELLLGLKI
jgi:hypothetical protein